MCPQFFGALSLLSFTAPGWVLPHGVLLCSLSARSLGLLCRSSSVSPQFFFRRNCSVNSAGFGGSLELVNSVASYAVILILITT